MLMGRCAVISLFVVGIFGVSFAGPLSGGFSHIHSCDEDIRLNGSSFAASIHDGRISSERHSNKKTCVVRVHVPMNYSIAFRIGTFYGSCNDNINITIDSTKPQLQYKLCHSCDLYQYGFKCEHIVEKHRGVISISFPKPNSNGYPWYGFHITVFVYFEDRYCHNGDYVCKIAGKYMCLPSDGNVNLSDSSYWYCQTNKPKSLTSVIRDIPSHAPEPYLFIFVLVLCYITLFVFILMFRHYFCKLNM